jgi:hypothetical protein
MHLFNGYDIELTKGDSLFFKINLDGRKLPEGSVGYFTVKSNTRASEAVIRKKMDASDGVLDIRLTSEDTDIPVRTYVWDVRVLIPLEEGGYEVETPMEYATLTILDAIGAPGDDGEPPGMDADLPILSLLVAEAREAIDKLNAGVSVDRIVEVLGYVPADKDQCAPIVTASNDGAAITGAIGGKAKSVVATLNPKLKNGSLAPNYDGGPFAAWAETKLNVNGNEKTAVLSSAPYIGSFDWVSGKVDSQNARVLTAEGFTLYGDPSTNSAGVKYIRVSAPEGFPDLTKLIACNRYTVRNTSPYVDKSIRANSNNPYIYDNDLDFDNPLAILEGLEFLLPLDGVETHFDEGHDVVLEQGANTITADSGDVTVEYGVDTKTYIDQKFAALSAALLGG